MIIHESLIELHMKSKSKTEIIETLAYKAKELGCISEVEGYLKDVFALEESFLLPLVMGLPSLWQKSLCIDSLYRFCQD